VTSQLALDFGRAKRWRDRHPRWVAPGPVVDPRRYAVDVARDADALAFVAAHHYAGTTPPVRLAAGLYGPARGSRGRSRLVGVAAFTVGVQHTRQARKYGACPPGAEHAACELGRFVLLDEVPFNAESWAIARALRLVAAEKRVAAVWSYADPLERRAADGTLVKPAHWGTAYRASNARYLGRAKGEPVLLTPSGRALNRRALDKIAGGESGHAYATRQVLAAGAPPRAPGEDPAAWVARILAWPALRRVPHPGNLVYAFALTDDARRALDARHGAPAPYPPRPRAA
jgi:hypothetical protein